MKVLYVKGAAAEVDSATMTQLRAMAPELDVASVQGTAEALNEVRRSHGWHAVLVSPTLPQNETLALIASLRRDRLPLAIVPVVDEGQKDLYAAAVASGADDVLLRRGQTLVNVAETLARIQQSPHLVPADQRRRIGVLYAGRDTLVWNLLEQVPFIKAEKVACGIDGSCPVRAHGTNDGSLRTDCVVIDEQPGDAHPLQVLKSVKGQASDLPVIVLTSTGSSDIATAALELGADDTVLKTGIFRRRLIATLRRVHQRLELTTQQAETKAREERLRQIVEHVPTGIAVIAADGAVLAMNAAALELVGATKPRDVVGKDFRLFGAPEHQPTLTDFIRRVTKGESASVEFTARALDGTTSTLTLRGVVLERDARGGRGVVASLAKSEAAPSSDGSAAAQLLPLQASLQRLEKHYAELEETRSQEQTAWDIERRRLEERLEEAEQIAKERANLATKLDEVTSELARTSHTFAAERQALEGRMAELESKARESADAGAARSEVEETLGAVREELRQAIAAHALERSGWQAIREELETRVRSMDEAKHLHAEQSASATAIAEDLRQLKEQLETERAAWAATRVQLESDLRNAREALWAEHQERDTFRAKADTELEGARQQLAAERSEWTTARTMLDGALVDLRRELEGAQAAALAASSHEDARRQVERDLEEVRRQLDEQRGTRAAFEARLTADLERAQEATRAVADEYDATRTRLESERDDARRRAESMMVELGTLRAAAADAGATARTLVAADTSQLESRVTDLTAQLDEWRRRAIERDALSGELDAARDAIQRLESASTGAHDSWDMARKALEATLADRDSAFAAERRAWERERAALSERGRDDSELRQSHDRLQVGLDALRGDYAAMRQSLATERAEREREQRRATELEAQLGDATRDRTTLERELDATTREAEALLRRRDVEYANRVKDLEQRDDSDLAAADSRLIASDMFGYALTTLGGELVRCNDAFARIFGYINAPDAVTRHTGRPFPALAGRTGLDARLATTGHIDRVESCLTRADGQSIRVIESATLLRDAADRVDDDTLVEHVMLAATAGPDVEELHGRRLQDVGVLASAMVPEIEGLVATLSEQAHDPRHRPEETARLAGQVAALVRQLGAYSRRQARATEWTDIAQVVMRTEPMLVRLAGDYIAFRTDLKPTSSITTPAADLDQLLTSLVTFGRDVLPAGGSIVVETAQRDAGKDGSSGTPDGPAIIVTASGYGAQLPERPAALEQVAERCGGQLRVTGEPGWLVRLDVAFPRCGGRDKSAWTWITDAD